MKGNVAVLIALIILSAFTIAVFALTVVLFVNLQEAKTTRQNSDDTTVPTTALPASTAAPPATTGAPQPSGSTASGATGSTSSAQPAFNSLATVQFTDEQTPWQTDYANPWSSAYSALVAYYDTAIKNALTASSGSYDNTQVTVNGFSGQYLDNGGTGTIVRFVAGVTNGATSDDIANDLQKGAQMNNYDWRDIGSEDAGLPPLPEPDTSVGWADAAQMFLSSMNTSVDPCQDFYRYSCDNYIATHPLGNAATQSTFDDLQTEIYVNLTRVFETLNFTAQASQTLKVTGDVYKACKAVTNETYQGPGIVLGIANDYGGWPLLDPQWDISKVPNDIYWVIGDMFTKYGVATLFTPNVDIDLVNVTGDNLLYLDQATLAIPAEYYNSPNLTDRYQDVLKTAIYLTVQSLGEEIDNATLLPQIDRMVAIEYYLAQISVNSSEQRNTSLGFNQYTVWQAEAEFPAFNWTSFFDGSLHSVFPDDDPATLLNPFIIDEPRHYVHDLNAYLTEVNQDDQKLRDLVNYLIFRLIAPYMQFAGPESAEIVKDMRRQARLEGPDITDQQQQCVSYIVNNIAYGAGRLYIDYYFPPQNRDDIAVMVNNLLSAFSSALSGLTWMDNESALKAFQKVDGLVRNVAYPDFQEDDAQLDAYYDWLIKNVQSIKPDDAQAYYEYVRQLTLFQGQLLWGDLKKPGDRQDFLMSPAIVNAWYQPERNSITFPAAILNQPFYRYDFPQAVNYGGFGLVAGHELSHGFDDEGIQYDANGTLHTWMTPQAEAGFDNMAQCVVDEYSQFCYPQGCINGIATQGENIADNGGLKASYHAYEAYVDSHGPEKPLPGLETFSMEQIFFLSFGQVWCGSYSDDALTRQLLTNPHSPGRDRVIGALQNFPQFAQAFNCKKGDPMYPVDSCDVW